MNNYEDRGYYIFRIISNIFLFLLIFLYKKYLSIFRIIRIVLRVFLGMLRCVYWYGYACMRVVARK